MTTVAEAIAAAQAKSPATPDAVAANDNLDLANFINNDPSSIYLLHKEDLISINNWLNSHPTFSMPGSLRSKINVLAVEVAAAEAIL